MNQIGSPKRTRDWLVIERERDFYEVKSLGDDDIARDWLLKREKVILKLPESSFIIEKDGSYILSLPAVLAVIEDRSVCLVDTKLTSSIGRSGYLRENVDFMDMVNAIRFGDPFKLKAVQSIFNYYVHLLFTKVEEFGESLEDKQGVAAITNLLEEIMMLSPQVETLNNVIDESANMFAAVDGFEESPLFYSILTKMCEHLCCKLELLAKKTERKKNDILMRNSNFLQIAFNSISTSVGFLGAFSGALHHEHNKIRRVTLWFSGICFLIFLFGPFLWLVTDGIRDLWKKKCKPRGGASHSCWKLGRSTYSGRNKTLQIEMMSR